MEGPRGTTRTLPPDAATEPLILPADAPARGRAGRRAAPPRGTGEAHRAGEVRRRPRLPRRLVRRHHPLDRAARPPAGDRPGRRLRLEPGRGRDRRRHPRRERRQPHRRRPAGARAGRRRDPSPGRAGGPDRGRRSGDAARGAPPHQPAHRAPGAGLRPARQRAPVRPLHRRARRCGGGHGAGAPGDRGDVSGRPPGAALHREPGHDRGAARGRRRHRPRLAAVPVLHPQGDEAGAQDWATSWRSWSRPRPAAASAARRSTPP